MIHEKDNNTEQMILKTAEKLFLEKGFAMTSTTEIAKEVGCNQAMVHYYFRTKEKLFESIFENKMKNFIAPFLKPNVGNLPFEEQLKNLIEAHFDFIKNNPKIPFLFFNELLTNPKRQESLKNKIAQLPQSVISNFEKDLQAEVEKGNIRPMNIIDLLLTIISLNVTIFFASPLINTITNVSDDDFNNVIEHRKRENLLIIMRSLKP